MNKINKIRVLTWNIHSIYLYYLTQTPCVFYLPHKYKPEEGYGARTNNIEWGENVISVPAEMIREIEFDCILFQSKKNYLIDQYEILSETQRTLPKLYLEHQLPLDHPTDTKHIVDDSSVIIVHVTHFNELMWDNNQTPTIVIDHGVCHDPELTYSGILEKGITVVNELSNKRSSGLDIFEKIREKIPLDIIGKNTENIGGLGEIRHSELPFFLSQYRFYFHPARYTSLDLSICEAMMIGMPIIGLATNELSTIIQNNESGFIHTDIDLLINKMKLLILKYDNAKRLGESAQEIAIQRFHIERFRENWHQLLKTTISQHKPLSL